MTSIIADHQTGDIEQSSKSVGYVYQGDKMVYHKFTVPGTILWNGPNVFFDNVGNVFIPNIDKIKNGLQFNFTKRIKLTNGLGVNEFVTDKLSKGNVQIPLKNLQAGYTTLLTGSEWAGTGYSANRMTAKVKLQNGKLQFHSTGSDTVHDDRDGLIISSANGAYQWYCPELASVTAY